MKILKSLILGIAILSAVPAVADDMRRETVRFAPGSSSSTIKASVKAYQTVQYALSVTAGQKMSVQLDSRNTSLYFNVTAPGADAAMYNSSIDGNEPPRLCRRPFGLSYAAIAGASSMA